MDIREYAAALIQRIEAVRPSAEIRGEAAFEQAHVVAPAWELARASSGIRVFTHPANRRAMCTPDCESAASVFANRVEGCPRCWATSKAQSVVDAFGMRHTFDVIAVDQTGARLAVEVKWLAASAGRAPNGDFQRFVGQCALAAATHDVVIGVCGFRSARSKSCSAHDSRVQALLRQIGVHLIVLQAER